MRSKFTQVLRDYFTRGSPMSANTAWRSRYERKQDPSFSQLLPWLDVDQQGHVLLNDAKSVAAVLELYPNSMETQSEASLDEFHSDLQRILVETFPGFDNDPWVMQTYTFMDRNALRQDWQKATRPYKSDTEHSSQSQSMRAVFDDHINYVATAECVLKDPLDNKRPWHGGRQRVLCCIYRYHTHGHQKDRIAELDTQLQRLSYQLETANIKYRILGGAEIVSWLQNWFEPDANTISEKELDTLKQSFDYSLSDVVCPRTVRSDDRKGMWYFADRVNMAINMQRLRTPPATGQLSLSQKSTKQISSLVEQLPPNAVIVMTLTFTTPELISSHLDKIDKHSVGTNIEALSSRVASQEARNYMLYGGRFYPFSVVVYLSDQSEERLLDQCEQVDALCLTNGIQLVRPKKDPVALDSYLRHLPMGYRYSLSQIRYRSSIIYVKDAASLLPLYGRAHGSGRLGTAFFNRGGGLLSYNPLDLRDRAKNGHLFVFGPTGAGKSATLNYLQMLLMAFHRPRIFVVEAGNSYGLLAEYFASQNLHVRNEVLRPGCGTQLAPFANAQELWAHSHGKGAQGSQRDWLGEMVLVARLMITGGQPTEEKRFNRADEAVLARAITVSTNSCKGKLRVSDVCAALQAQADAAEPNRRTRIREMSEAMALFTMGFAGELFDGEGAAWQPADYTRLELGVLAGEDYKDMLAVAWLGLVNSIIAFAEAYQHDGRPIILLTDEAHMITCNPLLSSYIVKISKLLGRRLGLWLWMATQNMSDFSGESSKMLDMFEWWLALGLSGSDINALCQHKPLTHNTIETLKATHKVSGKYTEGVLLGEKIADHFRHVPPALCLALAQTEKEEKTKRAELMRHHKCSELEAVLKIAHDISMTRAQN